MESASSSQEQFWSLFQNTSLPAETLDAATSRAEIQSLCANPDIDILLLLKSRVARVMTGQNHQKGDESAWQVVLRARVDMLFLEHERGRVLEAVVEMARESGAI
ncbi:hypothetical protein MKZ38_009726 [Zalerion maritima]|uniref:Uncharacterized protein n=1 Tax=Zalerion maritima TaxID=339359 RepID=A0AAD5WSU8_9PEZI|nr:hypothetical protein MKZ38_009726 [Zalerion maritima]